MALPVVALLAFLVADGLVAEPGDSERSAEDLLIVNCLLPGQIRRLGTRTTYVSARRPVKTTARDCSIRGGEYVAYDRATMKNALAVWLPKAQEGDVEAALYVGEIFERGVGGLPDYEAAAHWYQTAADAGDARAQINLGQLYETGNGVPRDPGRAVEWYRRAAGLDRVFLDSEKLSGDRLAEATDNAELTRVRERLQSLEREAETLRGELAETKRELGVVRSSLVRASEETTEQVEAARRLAEEAAAAQAARQSAELGQLTMREDLARREAEINALRDILSEARAQLAAARSEAEMRSRESAAQTQHAIERAAAREEELSELERRLGMREAELVNQESELERLRVRVAQLEVEARAEASREAEQEVAAAVRQGLVAGPEITLIEPDIQSTRGIQLVASTNVATVRPDVETRTVVGRALAQAGLLSVTVNDRSVSPNDLGVFSATVEIRSARTPVSVVAIDQQGKRDELAFDLVVSNPDVTTSEHAPSPARARIPALDFGTYHALIIGNNRYAHLPDLNTAVADARELERLLSEKYGFRTTLLLDADRYDILSALNSLRERLTSKDNLLVYYAGHGELDDVNMRGHWLPVDAESSSTANWISNVAITDILNVIAAKHVLVVADSCYSGSLTRSAIARLDPGMTAEERLNWLRTILSKRARVVFTSGGLQPVLDTGGGRHSVFGKALLDVLAANDEVMEGQRLHQQVAARVAYAAANVRFEQVPEYAPLRFAGHESGDFVFVPTTTPPTTRSELLPQSERDPVAVEILMAEQDLTVDKRDPAVP